MEDLTIASLEGRTLTRVVGSTDADFAFLFEDNCSVWVCEWRIVQGGRIVWAAGDHGQRFGWSEPLDGVAKVTELIVGRKVVKATLGRLGDIEILFDNEARLQSFTNSCGYESASIKLPGGLTVLVLGGGTVDGYQPPRTSERPR